MYSIILETPEFIEKQCSFPILDSAHRMFTFLQSNTDESDFTLFLIKHTKDEDPTDVLEEGRGIIDYYQELSEISKDIIIEEIRKLFKPLGMRGKLYNLVDVEVTNTRLYCKIQSRLIPELYIEFYSEIIYHCNKIISKASEEHEIYRLSQGKKLDIFTAKDLEIFSDMLKYAKDMIDGTEIEL